MSDEEEYKLGLVAEIRNSFASVPYPGDGNISTPPWDEGASEYFRATSQDGHDIRALRIHSAALTYFSPQAYQYFLPAFLIAVIEDPTEADTILDSLIYDFSHNRAFEIIPLLSTAQREATAKFFDYISKEYDETGPKMERIIGLLRDG